MKMLKWALLGGAAFAVSATAAQADDLAALKAQLESLQARVSQLESQPAPSVPEGYQLLAIRDGQGMKSPYAERRSEDLNRQDNGITVSVFPAADVAPSTEITVSGEIRTLLAYFDYDNTELPNPAFGIAGADPDGADVFARARLNVRGVTETAVGEVGVFIRVQSDVFDDDGGNATFNKGYGWWKFAPGWELMAGFNDNTAAIQAGVDWDFTLDNGGSISNSNLEQMRLTYNSGPITFAIAVEDTENFAGFDQSDIPAFAGYGMYNADGLMLQLTGAWQSDDVGDDDDWFVGGGARFALTDMFTFTAAAGFGEGYCRNNFGTLTCGKDSEIWGVNAGIITNLAEDIRFELGGWYGESQDDVANIAGPAVLDSEGWGVLGGAYWDPVSQVTVGVFAEYDDVEFDDPVLGTLDGNRFVAAFGTWLRF